MTKEKRKMVNVLPVSKQAKVRFSSMMDELHGCYVENEDDCQLYLKSINKRYLFCVSKQTDSHWKIVK